MEGIVYLLTLIIGIVLVIAQLRLFSIDATLKAILAELKNSGATPADQPASAAALELDRAKIADVQKNWPGYK